MKKHTRKIFMVILFGVSLFVVGCSTSEDSNMKVIETVLTNTFTGPSGELADIYKNAEEGNDTLDIKARQSYYQDHFKPYFTVDYYETVIKTGVVSVFHEKAYRNDVQMEVKEINIEQNEHADTSYDFTVNVQIDQKEKDVTGRLGIHADGEIFKIMYHNGYDLVQTMKEE
ncbi:hypothetical protein BN1058_00425 [Paraliobacillus sp. PM-2]|uniref:hypothetical protein n=1 Tax=Paraliobacillus sp. PM-2 TaxID=1462524 RepID=UPI00061C0460|nr:hypothetical protein [Paraliobacillus sp. PM-2]CQR46174.1 hypothetical protein BN1058_00425 [Paraliobacillus sp. PM-2]